MCRGGVEAELLVLDLVVGRTGSIQVPPPYANMMRAF